MDKYELARRYNQSNPVAYHIRMGGDVTVIRIYVKLVLNLDKGDQVWIKRT